MKMVVYTDNGEKWRWQLLARNGKIQACSGEAFDSKSNAKRAAKNFLRNTTNAYAVGKIKFVEDDKE